MNRKSVVRRKIELSNDLLPEVDLKALAEGIAKILDRCLGQPGHNVTTSNMVAADLKRKYLVSDKKRARVQRIIEDHPDELEAFLEQISSKELQWILEHLNQLPRTPTRVRARPESDAKRAKNLKLAKNRYETRRRDYREGLIQKEFGDSSRVPILHRHYSTCLDKLIQGEMVPMSGTSDSFENLLGVDRHDLPKRLPRKRHGRQVLYGMDALWLCMVHLLQQGQWLIDPNERSDVLQRVIDQVGRLSRDLGKTIGTAFESYI